MGDDDARSAGVFAVTGARRALLDWYVAHGRDLPWRRTGDPYAVWVSEVMLQQTQVTTVVPYYERWMRRFPNVRALSEADLDAVMGCWQGLGYYSRARHLHRAARQVVAEHGGQLPRTLEALLALPGIGRYTAGAIASIAFDEPVAAVDGNTRRVLARLGEIEGDPARAPAAREIERLAQQLVEGPRPGDLNQALMELGARLCVPRQPRCDACPVERWCLARACGREHALPATSARAAQRDEHAFAFILSRRDDDAVLVARRPDHGLLGGLWEFPMVRGAPGADARTLLASDLGVEADTLTPGPAVLHVFTHIRLTATLVRGVASQDLTALRGDYAEWRWIQPDLIAEAVPTSVLMDKLLASYSRRAGVSHQRLVPRDESQSP